MNHNSRVFHRSLFMQFSIALAVCSWGLGAAAQSSDLGERSLEDLGQFGLSNVPQNVTVTTASKIEQSLASAPSVMRVVTAEDIRVFGYRTLGEALNGIAGLYTSSDRVNTYLGARGFGRPGDYNTRILILVDGVRINDNVFDSALVGYEFPLDVALIERIEYAPGPGAAVYGNSAMFGVVNVFTRRPSGVGVLELSGEYASARAAKGRATWGKRYENGAEVLLSTTRLHSAGSEQPYYWDWFDAAPGTQKTANDFTGNGSVFGHLAYDRFKVSIALNERKNGVPIYFDDLLLPEHSTNLDRYVLVSASYADQIANSTSLMAQLSYHEAVYSLNTPFKDPTLPGGGSVFWELGKGRWWGGEVRVTDTRFSGHRITAGLDFQQDAERRYAFGVEGFAPDFDAPDPSSRYGVYVQDDIALGEEVTLIAGLRNDHTTQFDSTNPRLGVIWRPKESTTVKLLYGTAFRGPNHFEQSSNALFFDVKKLEPERIQTAEVALEHQLDPATRIAGSVYQYRMDGLMRELSGDADGVIFVNAGQTFSQGLELNAERRFPGGARLNANFAVKRATDERGSPLSNSPNRMLKMQFSTPLWSEHWRLGAEAIYMSERTTEMGSAVGEFVLANLTLTGKLGRNIDISGSIRNVGDKLHLDPARANIGRPFGVEQERRVVGVKLVVRY
jgi:iron complex outermembrane receptor protein